MNFPPPQETVGYTFNTNAWVAVALLLIGFFIVLGLTWNFQHAQPSNQTRKKIRMTFTESLPFFFAWLLRKLNLTKKRKRMERCGKV